MLSNNFKALTKYYEQELINNFMLKMKVFFPGYKLVPNENMVYFYMLGEACKSKNVDLVYHVILHVKKCDRSALIFNTIMVGYINILDLLLELPINTSDREDIIYEHANELLKLFIGHCNFTGVDKLFQIITSQEKLDAIIHAEDNIIFKSGVALQNISGAQFILSLDPECIEIVISHCKNPLLKKQIEDSKEFSQKLYQIRINNPEISIIKILQMKEYAESKDVKNLVEVSKSMLGLSEPAMDIILKEFDLQNKLSAEERREVLKAMAKVSSNQQKSEVTFVNKIINERITNKDYNLGIS
ncbi:hypothetical protein NOVO_07820 [Rickettsiales bacterium Ac37b]|nr:hypothetical protein NOVO_07820 [Rickettsiales bacterium Ac37b]